jgi:hypothetical protein
MNFLLRALRLSGEMVSFGEQVHDFLRIFAVLGFCFIFLTFSIASIEDGASSMSGVMGAVSL